MVRLIMTIDELDKLFNNSGKILFIGIGSEIRGDEAEVKNIIEKISAAGIKNAGAIWTDTRPENFLNKIVEDSPSDVIFVQASKFGGVTGEIQIVELEDHDNKSLHESPITTMSHYLKNKIGAKSCLLVIEPKHVSIGDVSNEMKEASNKISNKIITTLRNRK
jgi:hydrogenase 3 maturation protease